MNPLDHARSSARRFGGCWQDYHPVHDWLDGSKAAFCHFLHRALRHHREGVAEAVAVFGPVIRNADGTMVSTEAVGFQHLEEDCRRVPVAADWTAGFTTPNWWPVTVPEAEDLADLSARRFGGPAELYLSLHQWLLAPCSWVPTSAHLVFRHNAFALFEAERRFGPALGEQGRAVPTRVVAERHVRMVLGRIPAASDLLRRFRGERWMVRAVTPDELGLT